MLIPEPDPEGTPTLLIPRYGVGLCVNGLGRLAPTPVTSADRVEIEVTAKGDVTANETSGPPGHDLGLGEPP